MVQQPQWAKASSLLRIQLDTPHSHLWTSDQLVSETSTWQHTILTTDIHAPGRIGIHTLIHICMCICMYIRTYVCTYVCIYICMYVYIYVYIYTCVCVCVCMYVCMYACVYYIAMYVRMYVLIYIIWTCVCTYVWINYLFYTHKQTVPNTNCSHKPT